MNKIDNIDLATLGIVICRGGDDTFLRFPERKEPPQNNWFESDGLDVELSNPLFEPLAVKLALRLKADTTAVFTQRLNALETALKLPGERVVYIGDLDRSYTVRFVGISDYSHSGGLYRSGTKTAEFTLNFIQDNPTEIFTPGQLVLSGNKAASHILLNGVDLGDFGIVVQHLYKTALPMGDAKQGVVNEYKHLSGAIADTDFVKKEDSKQVELVCAMVVPTRDVFWQNYTALFNHLRKESALTLGLANGKVISCYYQSMSSIKKVRPLGVEGRVRFTIKLKTI